MYFGSQIGWRINEALSDVWPCMAGEWIWSKAAFGDISSTEKDNDYFRIYVAASTRSAAAPDAPRRSDRIRDQAAPAFIDFCVDAIDWSRFGLVGFSVVFQQLLSSLALARALKRKYPDLPIIMGGASLEDDIAHEVIRRCPQIDYMHCGDGEISFPEMVHRLYRGESLRGLRGLMWRERRPRIRRPRSEFREDGRDADTRFRRVFLRAAARADMRSTRAPRCPAARSKPRAAAGGERRTTARSAA